jgi:hypothetical protein
MDLSIDGRSHDQCYATGDGGGGGGVFQDQD